MPNDSKSETICTLASDKPARRRRSIGRMSDQEIRALFDALEPRQLHIGGRWWIRAAVAAVIAVCVFVLTTSRTPFHPGAEPTESYLFPADGTADGRLVSGEQAGPDENNGWEASGEPGFPETSKPPSTLQIRKTNVD
jgi:hypothetical protein